MSLARLKDWAYPIEIKDVKDVDTYLRRHFEQHVEESVSRIEDFENLEINTLTVSDWTITSSFKPGSDAAVDLGAVGATDYRFRHLYLSGNLSDETNSLTVANAKAAYTHVSNNGSDHGYIDQDVQVAASPTFNLLTLTDLKTKGPTVDARAHGMATGASAANNRTYLQAAIDGAPTGGVVLVPRDSAAYSLDNTTPLTITHGLTLIIQGEIDFTNNAADFCDITGDDVTIIGQGGKIKGPGTFDQSGSLDCIVFHVTGDRFTCRDLTLEDPVQCGFFLDGSADDVIHGVKIVGGTTLGSGSGTQNYGIEIEGATSTGIMISNVIIVPNNGGAMVQGIAGGTAAGLGHITVTGCYFEGMKDHATYLYGDYCTITGNTCNSTVGSSVRLLGKYNVISNNTIKDCTAGGIDMYNCDGGVTTGNVIKGFGFIGITAGVYGGYAGAFDNLIIANNSIEGATSGTVYCAIRLMTGALSSDNVQIINNTIQNVDSSGDHYNGIEVYSDGTDTIDRIKIDGNILDTIGDGGIVVRYITDGSISNNLIRDPSQQTANKRGIELSQNCDNIYITNNQIIKETGGNAMDYGIAVISAATNTNCIMIDNDVNGAGTSFFLALYSEGHRWSQIDASFNKSFSGDFAVVGSNTVKIALRNASDVERAFLQINDGVLAIDADSDIQMKPNNTTAATFQADGDTLLAGALTALQSYKSSSARAILQADSQVTTGYLDFNVNDNAIVIPETNGYLKVVEYNSNDILLYIKATGEVGVGTGTPDHKLDLEESVDGTSTILQLTNTHSTDDVDDAVRIRFSPDARQTNSASIIVGKDEDYSVTANISSHMKFNLVKDNAGFETMRLDSTGGVFMYFLKSGTDQANAGAAAGELYADTNDDNTVKLGV